MDVHIQHGSATTCVECRGNDTRDVFVERVAEAIGLDAKAFNLRLGEDAIATDEDLQMLSSGDVLVADVDAAVRKREALEELQRRRVAATQSSLEQQAKAGNAEVVQLLMHALGATGRGVVHNVCEEGQVEVLEVILRAGTSVAFTTIDPDPPRPPLHLAIERGHMRVVDVLLAHGVDVNQPDGDGVTPFSVALRSGRHDAALRLADRPELAEADGTHPPLYQLALCSSMPREQMAAVAQKLFEHGADPAREVRCEGNLTALHACAKSGNDAVAQAILDWAAKHGNVQALCDAAACGGWTPLRQAAIFGSTDVVALLVEAGADVEAQDAQGKTPVDYARMYDQRGVETIFNMALRLKRRRVE